VKDSFIAARIQLEQRTATAVIAPVPEPPPSVTPWRLPAVSMTREFGYSLSDASVKLCSPAGNFYGTISKGGVPSCYVSYGCGAIFVARHVQSWDRPLPIHRRGGRQRYCRPGRGCIHVDSCVDWCGNLRGLAGKRQIV